MVCLEVVCDCMYVGVLDLGWYIFRSYHPTTERTATSATAAHYQPEHTPSHNHHYVLTMMQTAFHWRIVQSVNLLDRLALCEFAMITVWLSRFEG